MRINESKNRRFFIMQQISLRENSRQKLRKTSAERRKKIEQSLGDFMKTMSDVSYRQTGGSEAFRVNNMNQNYCSQLSPQRKHVEVQYNEGLNSPSFQDIKIEDLELGEKENIKVDRQGIIKDGQYNEVKQRNARQIQSQVQKQARDGLGDQQQQVIEDEQIVYYNNKIRGQKTGKQMVQNNASIASSSGIFFTSQFNQFINQNHLQPIPQTVNNPSNEFQQQNKLNSKRDTQDNALLVIPTTNHQYKQQQQEQSSQWKQQSLQQMKQINQQINKQSDHHQQQLPLLSNKSNHSLAFSNESSLKYSLNESNIKSIINQKFTHQLIAHTNQFHINNQQQPSLFFHLKLQILIDRLHANSWKNFYKDFMSFFKLYQLSQGIIKRQKRTGFQAFLINQQLNLLQKKNQIKSENFFNYKQQQKFYNIFHILKQLFFIQPIQKQQKATNFYNQKQQQQTQKIFRCLKIVWFDQKVKKQIDLYYLSKLFTHFTRVIKSQKQADRRKCLSFYCFNLKKKFFKLLKQGVENVQTERIQKDNASCHYSFVLMRKVFDAWRDRLAYKDRYISLAMTTKNTFKETGDQRWMQIKTVDFRQIK